MTAVQRPSQRNADQLRPITITRDFTCHAEGSVLVAFGDTKVICTASVEEKVPGFLRGQGQGWLTAEYGMLPRSTHTRSDREAARGKQSGRTQEIQRLVGRSLRSVFDLGKLAEAKIEFLSGGEAQRVAIARALINNPAIIIADEPTAHLDTKLSHEFMGIMMALKARGATIVLASHDPIVYESDLVDRVVEMRDGQIVGGEKRL